MAGPRRRARGRARIRSGAGRDQADAAATAGLEARDPQVPARRGRRDHQDRDAGRAATTGSGRLPVSARPTSSRICCRSARVLRAREALDTLGSRLPGQMRVFRGCADCLGGFGAQRSLVADAAVAAVRAVADHAAAGRAVADHPPRDQDGGVRRRDPRGRHALRRRRHDRAARSVVPRGLPAHGHQARPFRQCRRAAENPARRRARPAHRTRPAQRFRMGPAADLDPRRHLQLAAVGDRERAGPGPPHPAPARRQGYCCRAKDRRRRRSRRPPP